MKSNWNTMRAADFISFNPRLSIKKGTLATKIAMDKLMPFTKRISDKEESIFTSGTKFCNGDTLMARITPCLENGKTAYVDILNEGEVAFGSTEYIVMRAKEGISDSQFIYYLATSPFFRNVAIKSMVGSFGRQRVQQSVLEELEILVPPLDEQIAIGSFLANLDDKIAINNTINDNLTEQFTALVDDMITNLTDYKELSLSDVADCQNGRAFYKEGYDDNGALVIDLGNVNTSATFVYTNADKYISLDRYNNPKFEKYRVYKDDLIMVMTDRKSTMDLLGKTGKVFQKGHYILNQRMYRIRSRSIVNTNYLYAILNSSEVCNSLKEKALGSVQKYINTGDINDIVIKVPSEKTMNEISEVINPIVQMIENNTIENNKLAKLRDFLLPKLMSGEIDISEVSI